MKYCFRTINGICFEKSFIQIKLKDQNICKHTLAWWTCIHCYQTHIIINIRMNSKTMYSLVAYISINYPTKAILHNMVGYNIQHTYENNLTLIWHLFPLYPLVHLHENPPMWSLQLPPFKHGFDSHSLYSKLQSSPAKPFWIEMRKEKS